MLLSVSMLFYSCKTSLVTKILKVLATVISLNSLLEDKDDEEESSRFYAVEITSGSALYIGKTKNDDHVCIYILRGDTSTAISLQTIQKLFG